MKTRPSASVRAAIPLAALAACLIGGLFGAGLPQAASAQGAGTEALWRRALGGRLLGSPETQASSVAVLSEDGVLRCFGTDGKELWTADIRGRPTPHLTRSREGTSYLGLRNGTLLAVNRSGRELWRTVLGTPLSAGLVLGWDGRIFVSEAGALSCYTAAGFRLWRRDLGAPFAVPPVADGAGGLLAALDGGTLLRIDPYGRVRREALSAEAAALAPVRPAALREPPSPVGVGSAAGPPEGGGPPAAVFYRDGRAEIRDGGGTAASLPPLPGRPVAAAGRGSRAAVLLQDGTVALASAETGDYLWVGTAAAADGGGRLLYDERGIYALSSTGAAGFAEDGRRLWLLGLRGSAGLPAFGDEGILYSGGADWILYAYRLEGRVLRAEPSPFGPEPEGRYGPPAPSPWADDPFGHEEAAVDRVLDEIAAAVRAWNIGEREEDYLAYLMEIAGKGVPRTALRPGTPPIVSPERRVRALTLLSIIGSRETVPFLAELFRRDAETAVAAAAAEALGRIGVDGEGQAMAAFAAAVLPPRAVRDERVLVSVAGAVGALCRFSGPPLSDAGVRLLVALSSDDRPPAVRSRAREELATLR